MRGVKGRGRLDPTRIRSAVVLREQKNWGIRNLGVISHNYICCQEMVIPTKCSKAETYNSVKSQLKRKHPKSTNTSAASYSEDGSADGEFTSRFELMDEIGSFGSVYRGLDRTTGQEVAIKMEKKTHGKLSSIAAEIRY